MARQSKYQCEKYMRYEDLPPPSPEEEKKIMGRLMETYTQINSRIAEERRIKLLSWADWAP